MWFIRLKRISPGGREGHDGWAVSRSESKALAGACTSLDERDGPNLWAALHAAGLFSLGYVFPMYRDATVIALGYAEQGGVSRVYVYHGLRPDSPEAGVVGLLERLLLRYGVLVE
jgi:hypothetical protein